MALTRGISAVTFAALPLCVSGFTMRRLRGSLANLHMQVGREFPSSERWSQHLVLSVPSEKPAVPVLVLQKDEYEEWVEAQSDDQRAFLAAAGLSQFKDNDLILLPERRWAFLTKNASNLFAFSSLPSRLPTDAVYELESPLPLPATTALSWGLGCYAFDACKGAPTRQKAESGPPKFASLLLPAACDADATAAALRGTYLCRDLINMPAGDMGPAQLEAVTRELAASSGATVATVEGAALLEGYPQIHAVGRAASEARQPRLIDLTWGDDAAPKVTLVGKGVCFDTGGLDIKPASAMLTMKKDMGGVRQPL